MGEIRGKRCTFAVYVYHQRRAEGEKAYVTLFRRFLRKKHELHYFIAICISEPETESFDMMFLRNLWIRNREYIPESDADNFLRKRTRILYNLALLSSQQRELLQPKLWNGVSLAIISSLLPRKTFFSTYIKFKLPLFLPSGSLLRLFATCVVLNVILAFWIIKKMILCQHEVITIR